jgi:ParB-like chromosome segregation protein Spo0J
MSMMEIEQITVNTLIPYARNSRTHSGEQVAQIAASIREFGFTNPVLIDSDGGIIAGHGRVMAARKLDVQEVPCVRLAHLTDTQKRAYIIADNKLALNAGWDDEMLKLEFDELEELGFDLELTGFTLDEIADLAPDEEQEESGERVGAGSLACRFMLPPFTVLNAREGWWQDRKKAWLAIGIKSELGRGGY